MKQTHWNIKKRIMAGFVVVLAVVSVVVTLLFRQTENTLRVEYRKLVQSSVEGAGDHWIGTEPYGEYFKEVGLDAVVGSVGNGATLRLISDIPGVKYTEGRFLPYFFPDVFHEGGDPIKEAKVNWVTARRAILRKPVDRIGYGGYLKLALQFPDFIQYIEDICNEFRLLYENVGGQQPYSHFTVGVLNSWGRLRS